ncbi:MAG: hypothetical protein ACRCUT_12615, partial [Spirochaetota bacterium]
MNKCFMVIVLCASFLMCASAAPENGRYNVLKYTSGASGYEKYLVTIESYTTNGSVYQKKYTDYLYGVARILTEETKMSVVERSIGFYY